MTTTHCPETLEVCVDPISAIDLALYAAASGDLNPLHLDAEVARAAGFDRPVAHGMRTMACVARLFTQHFGATALRALDTRFVGTAKLGDALVLRATLSQVENDIACYELQVQNAAGAPVVSGTARVAIAGRAERRAAPKPVLSQVEGPARVPSGDRPRYSAGEGLE